MKSIPYIEYTKLQARDKNAGQWSYMSHLANACSSADYHRTSAYAICLLNEGALRLESDLFVNNAQAPAIFTIAPSAIRKFSDLGIDYEARILFFRKEVFLEGQTDINYLDKFDFFEKTGQQVVTLNAAQFQQFRSYFDLIHEKANETAPHTTAIIRSLINIILNEIEDVHQSQQAGQPVTTDKGDHILSRFKTLLSSHFIQERQVSFYAGKMHLTPKYFSSLIKQDSGKTAGEWISEMLLLESKVRLQDKSQSIAQIAYDLNFSDPSHFGKFFKKHTGMSPQKYRN